MSTEYNIYSNAGDGGPIDYSTPVDTVSALTWDTSALTAGTWRFGVRAFDTVSGLEESNVDAVVTIVVNGDLEDVSAVPRAPAGLSVVPGPGGTARVAWIWPRDRNGVRAASFNLYVGTTLDYATPEATIAANRADGRYETTVSGLSDGITYAIGVRAVSAQGLEESNTVTVSVTGDTTAPDPVVGLTS